MDATAHRPALVRFLTRRTGDPALAEDLAQEVLLRAWQRPPAWRSDGESRAWLYRVAANLAVDSLRREGLRRAEPLADAAAARAFEDPGERLELQAALRELRPPDRLLLALQMSGYGHQEIAELLEIAPDAARKRAARARRRLRDALDAGRGRTPLVLLLNRDEDAALYADWLSAGGGVRVELVDRERAAAQLAVADGLLLSGSGRDLHPALYGQEQRASVDPDLATDRFDARVLAGALQREMAVLGLCRGHQLINIVSGGTLHQDLSEQGVATHHTGGEHALETRSGTTARALLGRRPGVPSGHHQTVNRLGRRLTVSSLSEDGVVEMIERDGPGWVVGLQWHAESPEAGDAGARLRDAFVAAAAAA